MSEPGILGGIAFRGAVMDLPPEGPGTKVIPVTMRVYEVQMPDLVDLLRGGKRLVRNADQINEFLIFLDRLS